MDAGEAILMELQPHTAMQKRTFVLRLAPGMEQEYIRRHQAIWPEMVAMLRQAGICNYSIWLWRDLLFGYYQSEDLQRTDAVKAMSDVQARWSRYMADIITATDTDGEPLPAPQCVFRLD